MKYVYVYVYEYMCLSYDMYMRLSSPCQRRCRSNPKWYGTQRLGLVA